MVQTNLFLAEACDSVWESLRDAENMGRVQYSSDTTYRSHTFKLQLDLEPARNSGEVLGATWVRVPRNNCPWRMDYSREDDVDIGESEDAVPWRRDALNADDVNLKLHASFLKENENSLSARVSRRAIIFSNLREVVRNASFSAATDETWRGLARALAAAMSKAMSMENRMQFMTIFRFELGECRGVLALEIAANLLRRS